MTRPKKSPQASEYFLHRGKCQELCCAEIISDVTAGAVDGEIGSVSEVHLALLRCGLMDDTGSSGCSGVGLKLMTRAWGDGASMAVLSVQGIPGWVIIFSWFTATDYTLSFDPLFL